MTTSPNSTRTMLVDRDTELADLTRFCTGPDADTNSEAHFRGLLTDAGRGNSFTATLRSSRTSTAVERFQRVDTTG